MAFIDSKKKLIQGKIVYYGPGLCGKTTNLEIINKSVPNTQELMSLSTEGDRTIFFDFLPMDLGKIRGISTHFKIYTVPGQVRYNLTRKMVLKNVDGVVFVADSQRLMLDSNLESLQNLYDNLRELRINPEQVQIFTPTPSTYSSLMYHTEMDPFTMEGIFVEKDTARKERQKQIVVEKGQGVSR